MDPASIAQYKGQIVQLAFADGARVQAHIISVDPDVSENHVFYDVLEVFDVGARPNAWKRSLVASSAQEILQIHPTDGKCYAKAPGSKGFTKPWWKFW